MKEARTRTGKKCCEQQLSELTRVDKALSRAGDIPTLKLWLEQLILLPEAVRQLRQSLRQIQIDDSFDIILTSENTDVPQSSVAF